MSDRQKKTPEQRALDTLGPAERAVTKTRAKVAELEATLAQAQEAAEAAEKRLRYAAAHPDLPEADRQRAAGLLPAITGEPVVAATLPVEVPEDAPVVAPR